MQGKGFFCPEQDCKLQSGKEIAKMVETYLRKTMETRAVVSLLKDGRVGGGQTIFGENQERTTMPLVLEDEGTMHLQWI